MAEPESGAATAGVPCARYCPGTGRPNFFPGRTQRSHPGREVGLADPDPAGAPLSAAAAAAAGNKSLGVNLGHRAPTQDPAGPQRAGAERDARLGQRSSSPVLRPGRDPLPCKLPPGTPAPAGQGQVEGRPRALKVDLSLSPSQAMPPGAARWVLQSPGTSTQRKGRLIPVPRCSRRRHCPSAPQQCRVCLKKV